MATTTTITRRASTTWRRPSRPLNTTIRARIVRKNQWSSLAEDIIIKIFDYLDLPELFAFGLVCRRFFLILSLADVTWRRRLLRDFKVSKARHDLMPGVRRWCEAYKLLHWHSPCVLTQTLKDHSLEVNHAAFNRDGNMLATCGADAMLFLYTFDQKGCLRLRHEEDLTELDWSSASSCSFNSDSSRLLVSGRVSFGRENSGEIAVIELKSWSICARVSCDPFDIFGCWFGAKWVVSSELQHLAYRISASVLCVNKIDEARLDHKLANVRKLLTLYNPADSACRHAMVVDALDVNTNEDEDDDAVLARAISMQENRAAVLLPIKPSDKIPRIEPSLDDRYVNLMGDDGVLDLDPVRPKVAPSPFEFSSDYHRIRQESFDENQSWQWVYDDLDEMSEDDWEYFEDQIEKSDFVRVDEGLEVINESDKLLIFTTATNTSVPHQVGIKRLSQVRFGKHMGFARDGCDRVFNSHFSLPEREEEDNYVFWSNFEQVSHIFDPIDYLIDVRGRITGLSVSEDNKMLYIALHPWPLNSNPEPPPPLLARVDCIIFSLKSFEIIGKLSNTQSSLVTNERCAKSWAAPALSEHFVALLDGDKSADLYDAHFGAHLASLSHHERVNCVAMHEDVAVTVSDDMTVRIWASRALAKKVKR